MEGADMLGKQNPNRGHEPPRHRFLGLGFRVWGFGFRVEGGFGFKV